MCDFEPGDALGMLPSNEPSEVSALLAHLEISPSAPLDVDNSPPAHLQAPPGKLSPRTALASAPHLEIHPVSPLLPRIASPLIHSRIAAPPLIATHCFSSPQLLLLLYTDAHTYCLYLPALLLLLKIIFLLPHDNPAQRLLSLSSSQALLCIASPP